MEGNHIEGELITGTSGGGIDLKDMNCSLEANTSAGDLNAEMNGVGKFLKLHTSGGNIDLKLPAKAGLDLNLSAGQISDNTISNFSGSWNKRSVTGSVNGGGVPVEAHANGSIYISVSR